MHIPPTRPRASSTVTASSRPSCFAAASRRYAVVKPDNPAPTITIRGHFDIGGMITAAVPAVHPVRLACGARAATRARRRPGRTATSDLRPAMGQPIQSPGSSSRPAKISSTVSTAPDDSVNRSPEPTAW